MLKQTFKSLPMGTAGKGRMDVWTAAAMNEAFCPATAALLVLMMFL